MRVRFLGPARPHTYERSITIRSTLAAISLAMVALLVSNPGSVLAQGDHQVAFRGELKMVRPPSKVAMHLRDARDAAREGLSPGEIAQRIPFIHVEGPRVRVDIRLRKPADAQTLAELTRAGLRVNAVFGGLVSGSAPLESIEAIAEVNLVTTVHPHYGGRTRSVGAADNQADSSLRAALARSTYGVDGGGIRIGILSDSVKDTIGGSIVGSCLTGSAPQLSGDLPSQLGVLDAGPGGGTDEGAGMAELIYDLCPTSHIAFHSAFNGIADFAQGIIELAAAGGCGQPGCHVICDDVIYFAEPMFQDGEIAQAVDSVVAAGVVYFSSAGNDADKGMEADFNEMTQNGQPVHDFTGNGNPFFQITFGSGGGQIIAVLQWTEPYSGTLGPGCEIDLDLYLARSTSNWTRQLVAASATEQGTTGSPFGDPLEVMGYAQPNAGTRYLVIHRFAGSGNTHFRLVVFTRGSVSFQSGILGGPTIYGHTAASGAMSVAAVYYGEVDTNSGLDINVEPYSSKGGHLPFFFDGSGNALPGAPILRFKPDLASIDGTNTTFFGSPDTDTPPDGFPNFYGTSAAAPHLAAVAALVLDRASDLGVTLTPAELYQLLRDSATDIESEGKDDLSGDGLVYADVAVAAVCGPPVITQQPISQVACPGYPISLCVEASGAQPLAYEWKKGGIPVDGATGPCYDILAPDSEDSGIYICTVSNQCGVVESASAGVDVLSLVAADFDQDCDVDADDMALLEACASGPAIALQDGCEGRDLDGDYDVDQIDLGMAQPCFSGPGILPSPDCVH